VGKYYQTMRLLTDRSADPDEARNGAAAAPEFAEVNGLINPPAVRPAMAEVPRSISRAPAVRTICERLAPLAVVDGTLRLGVAGCRRGDGASTIAAAIAIDLSQRLSLRTVLVDAQLQNPSLHRMFTFPHANALELLLEGSLQLRPTGWPRLELASCCVAAGDPSPDDTLADFDRLFGDFKAAVIDLGTPRLDARMLPLARPSDPVLLVVRYGATERTELSNTAAALRAANRSVAGVIMNRRPVPSLKWKKRDCKA
jgi:Mrp family chromosome partitioning ATPase